MRRKLYMLLFSCAVLLTACGITENDLTLLLTPAAVLTTEPEVTDTTEPAVTLIPDPTNVPNPTTVPFSSYEAVDAEGTLYCIDPVLFGIDAYCEAIQLFQVGNTPVIIYLTEYSTVGTTEVSFVSFDPETGEVLNTLAIPILAYYEEHTLVNSEGLLRVLDMATLTYYYIDEELSVVKELCLNEIIPDSMPYLSEDDSTVYYDIYDDKTGKTFIYGKDLVTGEEMDYSSYVEDCRFAAINTVLYNGELVVVEGYDGESFEKELFFITKNGELKDSIKNKYMRFYSKGTDFAVSSFEYFSEILISHNACKEDTLCYQCCDDRECDTFMYFPKNEKQTTDVLFTLYKRTGQDSEGDNTAEWVITLLSPLQERTLYEAVYPVSESKMYFSSPMVYLEETGLLMGVANDNSSQFLYLWNLSKEELCEEDRDNLFISYNDPEHPDEEQLNALKARAAKIGELYGINIFVGDDCKDTYSGYSASTIRNLRLISRSLDVLEETLSHYPSGFFEQLGFYGKYVLSLYLISSLEGLGTDTLGYASGLYISNTQSQTMVLGCDNFSHLERTIYHEFSHAIDHYIELQEIDTSYDSEWCALNPNGFQYRDSYRSSETEDGTYVYNADEDPQDDYFYDYYSKSYIGEDRARLAENVFKDGIEEFSRYPHIIAKLELMYETIFKNFDTTEWNGDFFLFDEYFGELN